MGILLAIEGIDGSGKGTQAAQLAETAAAAGHRVASFSFPLYDDNPFSRAVADYLNRYVGSNAAHQGAKLEGAARERLLEWLDEVEYGEFALPRPDLVVLLDSPVALARQLVGRKAARAYTTLEADIHEADAGHSGATRELYLELGRRDGWRIVSTEGEDGEPRDVGEVASEVWSAVEPLLR